MKNTPHRKQVRHYREPGCLHELTFSCYRRMPLLRIRCVVAWCGRPSIGDGQAFVTTAKKCRRTTRTYRRFTDCQSVLKTHTVNHYTLLDKPAVAPSE